MEQQRSGFWSTLPGILTGTAALITAATGGYLAFNRAPANDGSARNAEQPAEPKPAEGERKPAPDGAEVRATVVDPDGWTNLRSGPSTASPIVGRVNEGELFWTEPRDGAWWPVRTSAGAEGYIHRSRVRLNP